MAGNVLSYPPLSPKPRHGILPAMKRHALFVGVDQYADPTIQDLRCAVNDATDLAGFFKHKANFDRSEALANPRDCHAVLERVADLLKGLGPGDEFLFFFAGHGVKTQDGHRLVCAGDKLSAVTHSWDGIPLDRLKLETSCSCNRLFVLDACRTDVLATNRAGGAAMENGTRDLILKTADPAGTLGGTLTILCSCDDGESAGEILSFRHGLFSMAMLELLEEEHRHGRQVLLTDNFAYTLLPDRMRVLAQNANMDFGQKPQKRGPPILLLDGAVQAHDVTTLPVASPALVVCPVCGKNISPIGTYNCGTCGKKYVCEDCWDSSSRCCHTCAKVSVLIEEGTQFEKQGDPRAVDCFRQAAELGDKWSCHHYGDILGQGLLGVQKNVRAAFHWYLKADQTKPWVQYNIGTCHLHFHEEARFRDGKQAKQEASQAVEWLRKSAVTGIPWACVKLGDCFRDGIGVPQNFAQAATWYRKAADQNGPDDCGAGAWAEFGLGNLFRNGQGVERNLDEALTWYRKSMARNADIAAAAAAEVQEEVEKAKAEAARNRPGAVLPVIVAGVSFNLRRIPATGTQTAFWMGETQVTQALWTAVMGDNPSHFKGDAQRPVESVSWNDCQIFLEKLNAQDEARNIGLEFRLPSKEEWERACRAGSTGKYCCLADGTNITENSLGRVAWLYDRNPGATTHPVGQKEPNAWGLCDMLGNVWEWTQTAFGVYRVSHGGSFSSTADYCAAGFRNGYNPGFRGRSLGFRLAASDKAAGEADEREREIREARETELRNRQAGTRKVIRVAGVDVPLRWCPPGTFLMGSPAFEEGFFGDEMQHHVTLTKGFWMGETPVTQELWTAVMGANPSRFKNGDAYPVESVSWDDCQPFLKALNDRFPVEDQRWALPTEAQWEYACRSGTETAYAGTGRLDDMGWYDENSGSQTHPVGQKRPNHWGLLDMHGNVWEWCSDWSGHYPSASTTDPTGPSFGPERVYRGGSWFNGARVCRSAYRGGADPGRRDCYLGFRVALAPVP